KGKESSMETTSPASSSPVRVPPTPSSPNSFERPHRDFVSPARKTCTEIRTSNGYRGNRRALCGKGLEIEASVCRYKYNAEWFSICRLMVYVTACPPNGGANFHAGRSPAPT